MNERIEFSLPAGKYVLCDPCYVAKNEHWKKVVDLWDNNSKGIHVDFKNNSLTAFTTAFGDGGYPAECFDGKTREFGVDSGTIALTSIELCDNKKVEEMLSEKSLAGDALILEGPLRFVREPDGRIIAYHGREALAEIHTDAPSTYMLDERYENFRMNWLSANVDDDLFLQTLAEYAKEGGSFEKWIEENGFNGNIWPMFEEVDKTTLPWDQNLGDSRLSKLLETMDFEEFMNYCELKAPFVETGVNEEARRAFFDDEENAPAL